MRVTNRQLLTDKKLTELEFVPHHNELLPSSMSAASKVYEHPSTRACLIGSLGRPLLIT